LLNVVTELLLSAHERVREGKWIGVDEESKGVRVYWPDTRTVTVERNTYYDDTSASHLEGENGGMDITEMNTDLPTTEPMTPTMILNAKILLLLLKMKSAPESLRNESETY
jgi:hypothetical protein